jgi:hypothetical protein
MRPRLLTVAALLVSFTLDLATAAAPCAASTPLQASKAPLASSFHGAGMTHRHVSAPKKGGCCDPTQGSRTVCHRACHATAILRLPFALPALGRLTEAAIPPAQRSPSLFFASIDHIPLA